MNGFLVGNKNGIYTSVLTAGAHDAALYSANDGTRIIKFGLLMAA